MRPFRRNQTSLHQPVLVREVLEFLALEPGLSVVDATVGAGGHSRQIIERIRPDGLLIAFDRDPMMLRLASQALETPQSKVILRNLSYVRIPDTLAEIQLDGVDRILADLGLSSDQLADDERGFSFESDGPLDLRFNPSSGIPASELVQRSNQAELIQVFSEYGEEPLSRRIAEAIIEHRRRAPIRTARNLSDVIRSVAPLHGPRVKHPATRVFQALRIAVNDELQHVATLVNDVLPRSVVPGGRAAIITFHSLEDRLVKRAFREKTIWKSVTPKPVTATSTETRQNPRARSAKLRVAIRA